ncbi:hypothetical protein BDZ90DRAFT_282292, partial [Jaminaea rosea]
MKLSLAKQVAFASAVGILVMVADATQLGYCYRQPDCDGTPTTLTDVGDKTPTYGHCPSYKRDDTLLRAVTMYACT